MNIIQIDNIKLPISLLDYITSESEASRDNERSRIGLYAQWLKQNDMDGITGFSLVDYRSFLISDEREKLGLVKLSRASAAAHINSIRARYLYMLDKAPSKLRDYLYSQTPENAPPSDRKAYVDEMQLRIRERVLDKRATISLVQQSDETDERFVRLNLDEMLAYCESPLKFQHTQSI